MFNSEEFLKGKVDEIFKKLDSKVVQMINNTVNYDASIMQICNYVAATVTAESKGLLSTVYSRLSEITLSEPLFENARNANKFYDLDLRSKIYEKYNFTVENSIDFKAAHSKMIALGSSVGAASAGVILSLSLSNAIVIPIALVIAGALYPVVLSAVESSNKESFKKAVLQYLKELKNQLIIWFRNIVNYYEAQVEQLKNTL